MLEADEIEDRSLRAWPALHTEMYDGWLLRFARGYTKRANSVNPQSPGDLPVEEKVEYCERRYAEHGLPAIFRLTSLADVGEIDEYLVRSGYRCIEPSSVRCLELAAATYKENIGVEDWCDRPAAWHKVFHDLGGAAPAPAHRELLGCVPEPRTLMVLRVDDTPICCGLGVLIDGCLGLFDFVSAPGLRRHGYASTVVESMLAWGKARGAHAAYLQVVVQNQPATALYDRFGFSERYHYWYRVK